MNKVEPREGKQLSAGAHCLAREKLVDSVEEEAQQLFVCVIILVANNLPLHQLISSSFSFSSSSLSSTNSHRIPHSHRNHPPGIMIEHYYQEKKEKTY